MKNLDCLYFIKRNKSSKEIDGILYVKVCTHRYEINRIVVKPGDIIVTAVQIDIRDGGEFSLYFMPNDEENVAFPLRQQQHDDNNEEKEKENEIEEQDDDDDDDDDDEEQPSQKKKRKGK
jgi:hypothetical protein